MKIVGVFLAPLLAIFVLAAPLSAATVDGIQLHSSVSGTGSKAIMLVHGWTCNDTTWKSQIPALSKDYRVITLDLPGHGQSGSPKDGKLSMDLFARAIEAVRSEERVERFVLAGHSMGTPVIIQYARLYPQHTIALVLVDGLVSMPIMASGAVLSAEQFAGPEGLKMRENLIRSMFSKTTTPDMQKHILSMMLGAPAETAAGAMEAIMDPSIWKEDVFSLPVLGLYADGSSMTDLDYMKARFPKLDYTEIPGTGHFLMLEKPEEFNGLLLDFLNKLKWK
jgi:pimeloyl-ACP methyl ester carboxylesterase